MIFEDAHWADPTTLDLFSRTILRLPDLRVLLIVTYRPDFRMPWGHAHVTTLCSTVWTSALQSDGRIDRARKSLPSEVMEQIIAKTDGVPLFVEELTKTVLNRAY